MKKVIICIITTLLFSTCKKYEIEPDSTNASNTTNYATASITNATASGTYNGTISGPKASANGAGNFYQIIYQDANWGALYIYIPVSVISGQTINYNSSFFVSSNAEFLFVASNNINYQSYPTSSCCSGTATITSKTSTTMEGTFSCKMLTYNYCTSTWYQLTKGSFSVKL